MKRRDFVRTGAGAAMVATLPSHSRKHVRGMMTTHPSWSTVPAPTTGITLYDPNVHAMAVAAVEAAQHAGAQYADVRCTNIISRGCPVNSAAVDQTVTIDVSVRSLVNGYWGWSGTNMLSASEGVRVGQLSAQLATEAATRGRPRSVDLGVVPVVKNAAWETPVETDPFDLELVEVYDWLRGIVTYVSDRGYGVSIGEQPIGTIGVSFTRTERLFASSEGSLTIQTIKTIYPAFTVKHRGRVLWIPGYNRTLQGGWEHMATRSYADLYALVEAAREEADRLKPLSAKPANIGRYDIVYSAAAMAEILGNTLVPATELDRALGYEANATGTSYLGPDPMNFLGAPIASNVVTVTGERSTSDAVATVKWDDEGVAPEPFTLVKDGALIDYQTTREQAAWLASWYQKQGRPVQSRGCAGAPSAGFVTMQHTPNVILQPSTTSADDEALIAQMGTGLFVPSIDVDMDFQRSTGIGIIPGAIEIRNGKRVAAVSFQSGTLGTLFRTADFWKNVEAMGGSASARWFDGPECRKGDPTQSTAYSIRTVPALVKQQAIVDPTKKI